MNPANTITRGLMAAVPVCLVVVAVIFLRAGTIENANLEQVGLGGDTAVGWAVTWVIITLAFGAVASAGFEYLGRRWGWTGSEFLSFALMLAVALSALAFLRVYSGEMHPFRVEYSAFNFAYALGFGYAIPALTAARGIDRKARLTASRATQ